jgi:2-polyprenyl-6-methoxyphenol hydroxylase-like FAD-dependent oxidoreductase
MADVVIVGAGPTGLLLAGELVLWGLRPVLLESLPAPDTTPRANGLVGQAVRLMDFRGLYRPLVEAGGRQPGRLHQMVLNPRPARPRPVGAFMYGGFRLDLRRAGGHPLTLLAVPQADLERVLADRLRGSGAEIRRGHTVTGLAQDATGVTVTVHGPRGRYELRAAYVVGCDGGHSTVRGLAGIGFPGITESRLVSRHVHATLPRSALTVGGSLRTPGRGPLAPYAFHRTDAGVLSFAAFRRGPHLVNTFEWDAAPVDDAGPVTLDEMRASLRRVLGHDVALQPPAGRGPWLRRRITTRNTRLADRYRAGRVFLAGDSAHVFAGFGAPGLALALPEAVNLGWKLSAAVQGWAPDGLLDTYQGEREAPARRAAEQAAEQSALLAPGPDADARRQVFAAHLRDDAFRRRLAAGIAGDVPSIGSLVPDLPLIVGRRPTRVAALLRTGRAVLLDLRGDAALRATASAWAGRVTVVTARCLRPGLPAALLVRPDGHVAWTPPQDLRAALISWFGRPG